MRLTSVGSRSAPVVGTTGSAGAIDKGFMALSAGRTAAQPAM
jgi:hypothetical protein